MRTHDPATLASVGVLAATLAAVWHEAVGHGLGCMIDHGEITLLTSIFFRCRGATALTDATGPFASLIAGVAGFAIRPGSRTGRLFWGMFGGIGLLWFSGQLVAHAATNGDDWFFIAHAMGWSPVWRPIAVLVGVCAYAAAVKAIRTAVSGPIRLAYAASVLSAVVAGLMWHPAPIRSAVEGFLTIGILPLGLLFAERETDPAPVVRSWRWIAAAALVYAAFLLTQGRGLGSAADTVPW